MKRRGEGAEMQRGGVTSELVIECREFEHLLALIEQIDVCVAQSALQLVDVLIPSTCE
jgi:hypothetical protein